MRSPSVIFGLAGRAWKSRAVVGVPVASAARADADALRQKFLQIAVNGRPRRPEARQTAITDEEVNAYILALPAEELPQGLVDPQVSILPDGRALRPGNGRSRRATRGAVERQCGRHVAGQGAGRSVGVLRTRPRALGADDRVRHGRAASRAEVDDPGTREPTTRAAADAPEGFNLEAPFRLPAQHPRDPHGRARPSSSSRRLQARR